MVSLAFSAKFCTTLAHTSTQCLLRRLPGDTFLPVLAHWGRWSCCNAGTLLSPLWEWGVWWSSLWLCSRPAGQSICGSFCGQQIQCTTWNARSARREWCSPGIIQQCRVDCGDNLLWEIEWHIRQVNGDMIGGWEVLHHEGWPQRLQDGNCSFYHRCRLALCGRVSVSSGSSNAFSSRVTSPHIYPPLLGCSLQHSAVLSQLCGVFALWLTVQHSRQNVTGLSEMWYCYQTNFSGGACRGCL